MPWAKSFCPFRACGTKLANLEIRAYFKKSILRKPTIDYQQVTKTKKCDFRLFQVGSDSNKMRKLTNDRRSVKVRPTDAGK